MQAGDADVLVDDDARAEQLRADPRLVQTGPSDVPAETMATSPRGSGTPRATQMHRASASSSASSDLANGGARCLVGASGEDAARSAFEQRGDDPRDLLGRLALGEHGLGRTLAKLAMDVDAGEAEVSDTAAPRVARARRRGYLPAAHGLEQLAEIVAEPCHRAIVR